MSVPPTTSYDDDSPSNTKAPLTASQVGASTQKVCVKSILYEPTLFGDEVGLCIYLGAVKDRNNSCGDSQAVELPSDQSLNWVQTYQTNSDNKQDQCPLGNDVKLEERCGCRINVPHKDFCEKWNGVDSKRYGPLYRSELEPSNENKPFMFEGLTKDDALSFGTWKGGMLKQGDLQFVFRDHINRPLSHLKGTFTWHTAQENSHMPTIYQDPVKPATYRASATIIDNDLRLVRYPTNDLDPAHFDYIPVIKIRYGFSVDTKAGTVTVDPLYIGSRTIDSGGGGYVRDTDEILVNGGGTISLAHLRGVDASTLASKKRPAACIDLRPQILEVFPGDAKPFPYDSPSAK